MGVGKSAGKEGGGGAKSFGVLNVVRQEGRPTVPRACPGPQVLPAPGGKHPKSNNKHTLEGQQRGPRCSASRSRSHRSREPASHLG